MSACKVTETSSLKSSSAPPYPPTDKLRHGRPSAGPQWRWRITSYAITRRTGHSDPPRIGFATEGSRAHAASNLVSELIDGACDGSDYGAVAGAVSVRGEIALSTGKGL